MDQGIQDNPDFMQRISDRYNDLTRSGKRIADFFNRNQDESCFLSAAEVAGRLDLSEATVVRFARTLGYPSYPAMRTHIQQHLRQRITHSSRLRSRLQDMRESGDIFERLTATEMDYLSQALESVDRMALKEAVQLIREHKRIFVFGLGPALSLVDLLEIRLKRFGKDIVPLRSAGREVLDSLLMMTSDDLIFVICFQHTNPTLKLILDYSKKMGASIIALTDTFKPALSVQADVIISALRGPMGEFHSLVVPMTVINTLLLSLADSEQEKIMPLLDKLDALRDQLRFLSAKDV
jgi:DNA-binding MurR/RpiR family transcriptional regulator